MGYIKGIVSWLPIRTSRMGSQHRLWQRLLLVLVLLACLVAGLPARAAMPSAPLIDIDPGDAGSAPGQFTTVNDSVFFTATTAQSGRELWKTNGTRSGTLLVKDLSPGPASSSLSWLTKVGSKLFFFVDNNSASVALWMSDGTAAGTVLVKQIAPGAQDISAFQPIDLNGVLIFGVHYFVNSQSHSILWRSDGTSTGTTLVKDLNYPGFGPAGYMAKLGTNIFFAADDGTPFSSGLWKTDGTAVGTTVVKNLQFISELQPVGNVLFFKGGENPGLLADELWKTDGTPAGTVLVRDINVGNQGSSISDMTEFKGQLFFQASGGDVSAQPPTATGRELWKSDGTTAGTVLVKDIAPGFAGSEPRELTIVNDTLYFTVQGELWKSDGSAAGTVQIEDISTGFDPSYPRELTAIDGSLLFWADDGIHGREPWVSDGTAACTALIQDISPNESSATNNSAGYVNIGAQTLFSANDGHTGAEPWALSRHVDALVQAPTLANVQPAGVVSIPIRYDNSGVRPASSAVLSVTLAPELSYVSDTSGITPTINGQNVQWSLAPIKLRCGSQFLLRVRAPDSALGARYSIAMAINSAGPEVDISDNTAETTLVVWDFAYVPVLQR